MLALVHTGEAGPPGCQQLYEDKIDEGMSLIAFQCQDNFAGDAGNDYKSSPLFPDYNKEAGPRVGSAGQAHLPERQDRLASNRDD